MNRAFAVRFVQFIDHVPYTLKFKPNLNLSLNLKSLNSESIFLSFFFIYLKVNVMNYCLGVPIYLKSVLFLSFVTSELVLRHSFLVN